MNDLFAEINWCPGENFALVYKTTGDIFLGSDTEEPCRDALNRMTPAHPKFDELVLVKRPNELILF